MIHRRLVLMRRGASVPAMVGLCIGLAIFLLAMISKIVAEGVDDPTTLAMTITLALFVVGMSAML